MKINYPMLFSRVTYYDDVRGIDSQLVNHATLGSCHSLPLQNSTRMGSAQNSNTSIGGVIIKRSERPEMSNICRDDRPSLLAVDRCAKKTLPTFCPIKVMGVSKTLIPSAYSPRVWAPKKVAISTFGKS